MAGHRPPPIQTSDYDEDIRRTTIDDMGDEENDEYYQREFEALLSTASKGLVPFASTPQVSGVVTPATGGTGTQASYTPTARTPGVVTPMGTPLRTPLYSQSFKAGHAKAAKRVSILRDQDEVKITMKDADLHQAEMIGSSGSESEGESEEIEVSPAIARLRKLVSKPAKESTSTRMTQKFPKHQAQLLNSVPTGEIDPENWKASTVLEEAAQRELEQAALADEKSEKGNPGEGEGENVVAWRFHEQAILEPCDDVNSMSFDNGVCRIRYTNGDLYEGGWDHENGFRSGWGVYQWKEGAVYSGDWHRGLMHGKHGEFTWSNGDSYCGEWRFGVKNGRGEYQWASGAKFEAKWHKNSSASTHGTYVTPDNYAYVGQWVAGRRHGHGTLTWPNGTRYTGSWVVDQRDGKGTFESVESEIFEGHYRKGQRHGPAKFTSPEGAIYVQQWNMGVMEDQQLQANHTMENKKRLIRAILRKREEKWKGALRAQGIGTLHKMSTSDDIETLMKAARLCQTAVESSLQGDETIPLWNVVLGLVPMIAHPVGKVSLQARQTVYTMAGMGKKSNILLAAETKLACLRSIITLDEANMDNEFAIAKALYLLTKTRLKGANMVHQSMFVEAGTSAVMQLVGEGIFGILRALSKAKNKQLKKQVLRTISVLLRDKRTHPIAVVEIVSTLQYLRQTVYVEDVDACTRVLHMLGSTHEGLLKIWEQASQDVDVADFLHEIAGEASTASMLKHVDWSPSYLHAMSKIIRRAIERCRKIDRKSVVGRKSEMHRHLQTIERDQYIYFRAYILAIQSACDSESMRPQIVASGAITHIMSFEQTSGALNHVNMKKDPPQQSFGTGASRSKEKNSSNLSLGTLIIHILAELAPSWTFEASHHPLLVKLYKLAPRLSNDLLCSVTKLFYYVHQFDMVKESLIADGNELLNTLCQSKVVGIQHMGHLILANILAVPKLVFSSVVPRKMMSDQDMKTYASTAFNDTDDEIFQQITTQSEGYEIRQEHLERLLRNDDVVIKCFSMCALAQFCGSGRFTRIEQPLLQHIVAGLQSKETRVALPSLWATINACSAHDSNRTALGKMGALGPLYILGCLARPTEMRYVQFQEEDVPQQYYINYLATRAILYMCINHGANQLLYTSIAPNVTAAMCPAQNDKLYIQFLLQLSRIDQAAVSMIADPALLDWFWLTPSKKDSARNLKCTAIFRQLCDGGPTRLSDFAYQISDKSFLHKLLSTSGLLQGGLERMRSVVTIDSQQKQNFNVHDSLVDGVEINLLRIISQYVKTGIAPKCLVDAGGLELVCKLMNFPNDYVKFMAFEVFTEMLETDEYKAELTKNESLTILSTTADKSLLSQVAVNHALIFCLKTQGYQEIIDAANAHQTSTLFEILVNSANFNIQHLIYRFSAGLLSVNDWDEARSALIEKISMDIKEQEPLIQREMEEKKVLARQQLVSVVSEPLFDSGMSLAKPTTLQKEMRIGGFEALSHRKLRLKKHVQDEKIALAAREMAQSPVRTPLDVRRPPSTLSPNTPEFRRLNSASSSTHSMSPRAVARTIPDVRRPEIVQSIRSSVSTFRSKEKAASVR